MFLTHRILVVLGRIIGIIEIGRDVPLVESTLLDGRDDHGHYYRHHQPWNHCFAHFSPEVLYAIIRLRRRIIASEFIPFFIPLAWRRILDENRNRGDPRGKREWDRVWERERRRKSPGTDSSRGDWKKKERVAVYNRAAIIYRKISCALLVPGRRRTYSRTQCDASSGNLLYICVRVADVTQALENISDPRNRTLSSDSHAPPIFFPSVTSENFALLCRGLIGENSSPPRVWNDRGREARERAWRTRGRKSYRGYRVRRKEAALQRLGLKNRETESGLDVETRVPYAYSVTRVSE